MGQKSYLETIKAVGKIGSSRAKRGEENADPSRASPREKGEDSGGREEDEASEKHIWSKMKSII